MKKIIYISFLLMPTIVYSQKNFEGVISYVGSTSFHSGKFFIEIYYGKSKMRVEAKGEDNSDYNKGPITIIFDLEQGIQYSIDSLNETVEIDSLKYSDVEDIGVEFYATENIKKIHDILCLQHNAKEITNDSTVKLSENNFAIWFAKDIKYIIPAPYRNKRSLLTAPDGNCIWLEFSVSYKNPFNPQKETMDTVNNKVISIDQKIFTGFYIQYS